MPFSHVLDPRTQHERIRDASVTQAERMRQEANDEPTGRLFGGLPVDRRADVRYGHITNNEGSKTFSLSNSGFPGTMRKR